MSNVFVVGFKNVDEDSDSFLPLMVLSSREEVNKFSDILAGALEEMTNSFSFRDFVFEAKYHGFSSEENFLGYEVSSNSKIYPKIICCYEDMVYYKVPSY
jgi:hypothetical protein